MNGLLIGIILIIVVPLFFLIIALKTENFGTIAVVSLVIGLFLLGLPLGSVSLYCTRKWYKRIKTKNKWTRIKYVVLMVLGVLIIVFGLISLIIIIIYV